MKSEKKVKNYYNAISQKRGDNNPSREAMKTPNLEYSDKRKFISEPCEKTNQSNLNGL